MKPVAIFRHSVTEGPGYFARFLDEHGIPWTLLKVDAGDAVPEDALRFSGLVFMGGPMSVNDNQPWIPEVLALIRSAVSADVPTLGHCLGGQLMSKALGGTVSRHPVKEIGWGEVIVGDHPLARQWFGELGQFLSFQWHGETFSIPDRAVAIASSRYCTNQAFALGPHLAMQFHVEMTPELIRSWCQDWEKELIDRAGPSVQTPALMLGDLEPRVSALNAVAARLYSRWIEGLRRIDR